MKAKATKFKPSKGLINNLRSAYENINNVYLKKPDDCVYEQQVHVNGKQRSIVTYKNNTEGMTLRYYHRYLDGYLKAIYKSSDSSFAYKEGFSINKCIEKHLNAEVFLKADIHSYFDTVNKDILAEKLIKISGNKNKSVLTKYAETGFYYDKMPIGFITSPILSDIYLNSVDEYFFSVPDIVYTRYADDFIISSSGKGAEERLKKIKNELIEKLKELNLELNDKKTYIRRLKQAGDAIHILGLNIVYDEPGVNHITVSDKYIRNTSKEYCEYLLNKEKMNETEKDVCFTEVYGKIQFIKNSSIVSAKKLEKMLKVKLGRDVKLEYNLMK